MYPLYEFSCTYRWFIRIAVKRKQAQSDMIKTYIMDLFILFFCIQDSGPETYRITQTSFTHQSPVTLLHHLRALTLQFFQSTAVDYVVLCFDLLLSFSDTYLATLLNQLANCLFHLKVSFNFDENHT